MRFDKDKRLLSYGSKKKKSNRDGKVCAEYRRLRKRSRQIGRKVAKNSET